ncbi:MAG: HD domain-containing protein [Spirochaetales bacterium]|nr:HD domain-containing protein [Spirochaetales bacterium]
MKSPKEQSLDRRILDATSGSVHVLAELLMADPEVAELQDYANAVSIRRLGINDHGPVHMRKVALNALAMAGLLGESGVKLSLERDEAGTREDSLEAILLASFLHDIGMSIGRHNHEQTGALLAHPIIDRLLQAAHPDEVRRRVTIRSMALEGILGHMATQRIHSVEAGLVLVADGCDMEHGRSRIPMMLSTEPRVGDIHQYSSAAVERVSIGPGDRLPVRISVEMTESVGIFQVEEVLLQKVAASPAKGYIELVASVAGGEPKRYLG